VLEKCRGLVVWVVVNLGGQSVLPMVIVIRRDNGGCE
jgi:hypothetical protein